MAASVVAGFFCRRSSCLFSSPSILLGVASGRRFSHNVVSRLGKVSSCSLVPRKSLMLTSAASARVYGPEELNERKDEVHHWTNERYVAVALIPLVPAALVYPNLVLDTALCAAMILHIHWRLSGVVQDYIHGGAYYLFKYLVLFLSVFSFGSLCYFNYTDIGFSRAARLIFKEL